MWGVVPIISQGAMAQSELQGNPHYSGFVRVVEGEATVPKHLKHLVVASKNIRREFTNLILLRDSYQVLKEQSADAVALIFIEHGERHFSAMRILCADVPADANEPLIFLHIHRSS